MPTGHGPMPYVIRATQSVLKRITLGIRRVRMKLRSHIALAAEALFLQRQLALYQNENGISQREMNATRFTLALLSYWFDWKPALTIVQPQTFKRWRRRGWRLLLTPPARLGRPPIPLELQTLIRRMARENVTWGQQRIANELFLKLGLRVSPRTVRKYTPSDCVGSPGKPYQSQRWSTFIRNHAKGLVLTGMTAAAVRSVMAWFVDTRRRFERLAHWIAQQSSTPIKTHHHLEGVRVNDTCGIPGIVSRNSANHLAQVERSPPAKEVSRPAKPMSVTPAQPVAGGDVYSALPVRCQPGHWRHQVLGLTPTLKGGSRSNSLSRVA